MDRQEFLSRYLRFDRTHRAFIGLALAPFFAYFAWFLFFSGLLDGFILELSWRAAIASVILLALCFGGIVAAIASVPLLLVSITSGTNAVDENRQIVLIGEDDSPVTDPKPINLAYSLEAAHIATVFLAKPLDGS